MPPLGQVFSELPETYAIFIAEKDYFGQGEPIYVIERMNLTTGKPFGDGEHIRYVNGEYRGDSDIGKLMHDVNCTDAKDMYFEISIAANLMTLPAGGGLGLFRAGFYSPFLFGLRRAKHDGALW